VSNCLAPSSVAISPRTRISGHNIPSCQLIAIWQLRYVAELESTLAFSCLCILLLATLLDSLLAPVLRQRLVFLQEQVSSVAQVSLIHVFFMHMALSSRSYAEQHPGYWPFYINWIRCPFSPPYHLHRSDKSLKSDFTLILSLRISTTSQIISHNSCL
jgi:hypothetical protein